MKRELSGRDDCFRGMSLGSCKATRSRACQNRLDDQRQRGTSHRPAARLADVCLPSMTGKSARNAGAIAKRTGETEI